MKNPSKLATYNPKLFAGVLHAPFLTGSILVASARPWSWPLFLALGALLLSSYVSGLYSQTKRMIPLFLLQLACIITVYHFLSETRAILLVILASAIGMTLATRKPQHPRALLIDCALLIFNMGLLSLLGVYTQYPQVLVETAILGIVPGFILASAMVARHSPMLAEHKWTFEVATPVKPLTFWKKTKKRKVKRNKVQEEETRLRPGSIPRLFSMLSMIGPGIIIFMSVLGFLPSPFTLVAFVLLPMTKAATAVTKTISSPEEIASYMTKLSIVAALGMLLLGLMSLHT